jgi:hypothetical protein
MNDGETKKVFSLPYLLSFDGKGGEIPGRGEAGWSVTYFDSAEARAVWMLHHGPSRMPAWSRIERGEA